MSLRWANWENVVHARTEILLSRREKRNYDIQLENIMFNKISSLGKKIPQVSLTYLVDVSL